MSAMISGPIGIRTGPQSTVKDLPWSTCALRSNIASQIHIAGRICTSVSRQLVTSSLSPLNSMAKAPMAKASGAYTRRDSLRRRIASSILASSLSWMARTSDPMRAESAANRRPLPGLGGSAADAGESGPFAGLSVGDRCPLGCAKSSEAWSPGGGPPTAEPRGPRLLSASAIAS